MQALVLLLWAVIIGHSARGEVVTDPTICGRMKCSVPQERKFKYEEGTVYKYNYAINVSANLGDHNKNDESALHIDATVLLTFTSPCEGRIKLKDTSISHDRSRYRADFPDRPGAEFKSNLERYVLKFAFNDGQIREVCSDPREDTWALNLKRGVLSMLQNSMLRFDVDRRVDELDINGVCETRYKLHEAKKTSLLIRKWKNLDRCSHSGKHLSILQSTAYRSPLSQDRTLRKPLLSSHSECEITIDHNIYEKVVCNDFHRVLPFSSGDKAGARADITSNLELISEEANGDFDEEDSEDQEDETNDESISNHNIQHMKRSNLLYDHRKTPRTIYGELRSSRDLLKIICSMESGAGELQQSFSDKFTKFVHSMRLLDYPSLSQLFIRANGICKNGRKHIIEALPYIGSNGAVNLMKDLILKEQVNKEIANNWVTSFALIPRPTQETVRAIKPLLEFQHTIPHAQFILSYSAVIHSYCVSAGDDCSNFPPIVQFVSYLEEKIESGCTPRTHPLSEVKQTLEAIKAIGNMGVESKTLMGVLRTCIDDPSGFVPMDVRIAAIDAHRRLPSCVKARDEFFLNHYRNSSLDSEIRIASYLQVMRCPDYNVVKIVKSILEEEEVNQVGSFVWSHLTNLLSSSSPTRIEIQSLLTDRDLGDKFNSDLRKFSRNYENSFFSEEYNFGANHQTNVIFSSKSYIPRTAMLNVTIDLFGESVNLFEVSMRAEGLEFYAENLFGPTGPFGNEKVGGRFRQFLRHFRSANDEDEDYWKRVKRLPNVIDNNFDHPKISLSYKIFGNELKFTVLDGDQEIRSALSNLNPWTKIKQILSGKEIHYKNTAMILDSSYVVPTSVGLPVRLDVTASAACNFKMAGLLNSERMLSNAEMEFVGSIMPSMSVDVAGSMTVDSVYKSAGIKLRTNVYSSGAIEARLNIKGARLASLSLSLPNDKMEVLSLRSNILFVSGNGAETIERAVGQPAIRRYSATDSKARKPQIIVSSGSVISNTTCSWSALDRLIGLKLCSDYHFPNVTNNPNASYFVLNGPTLFKLSLIKADPTAKSYLLEYKWERTPTESVIKVAFDTPGSQIQRELSATLSFDVKNNNVTLLLQSAGNSLIAKGTYKRTDDEMFIDVGLDIKGTKHLDASVGYSRKKGNFGYTYSPKLYIAINSERIAELSGTIRNQHKSNISQCDIDLTFQTKRVWSRALGYIMKRNTSIESNVKIDYQLQKMPKKETLQLEISLINRSSKTLAYRAANIELHSTAYPHLNAIVSAWYQQALGHLELHVEVNSSPHLRDDRHKLTAKFVVAYSKAYFHNPGAKISADFSITKPVQNLDIKVGVQHTSIGVESKSSILIRYAPGKEIVLTISTNMPRGALFAVEGHANLTIPNFNSMLIDARISERSRHEYDLDFAGTWFSGHNITARGTYIDKSNAVVTSHSLKILLKSPHFASDILLNCKLYQDVSNLRIGLHAEQLGLDKYALVLNHTTLSPQRLITYAEIRYKSDVYSVLTNVDMNREISAELHLDRWRDVHFGIMIINEPNKKEYGIEVKWDANRDPSLKVSTNLRLNKHANEAGRNVSALATITYPGRLIIMSGLCALRAPNNYILDASLEWSPDKAIKLLIDADYKLGTWSKILKLESQLLSPFENWKKTSLNARYELGNGSIIARSSAYWQDSQRILFEFDGKVKEKSNDNILEWSANCGLVSTVHTIEWITVNLTHKQVYASSIDSRLLIKYHPDKVVDIKSIWRLNRDEETNTFNLTGNLNLVSPLANYRKGELRCHLRSLPNWKFLGAANIDLDKRKYTAHLTGDLTTIKESMVQFNITTPIEKYAFIQGRFGLSETNRYIVAELSSPAGPLGFEIICQLFTSTHDFNIKFLVATPIDVLQQVLLVAKLSKKEADFRAAYNNMTVGFQGVWYFDSFTRFHYSYIIYTPFPGFQEIGLITKLLIDDIDSSKNLNVDTEFSARVMELKAGFKAQGGPKPPPVTIPIKNELTTEKTENKNTNENKDDDDDEDSEEDEENNIYWRGDIEINAVILEPITGILDVDKIGYTYNLLGYLKIPQGKIVFEDHFFLEDFFYIKNDLSIDTPFIFASEITSDYIFNIDLENSKYLMLCLFNVKDNVTWHESGFIANYTYQEGEEDDSKTHKLELNVKTPLSMLKYINTTTEVEFDENISKALFIATAEDCNVDLSGLLEMEDNFWHTMVIIDIASPVLTVPKTKAIGKADFTGVQKQVDFGMFVDNGEQQMTNQFTAEWKFEPNSMKANFALSTWIEALKSLEAGFQYNSPVRGNGDTKLNMFLKYYPTREYIFVAEVKDKGIVIADLHSSMPSARHLTFTGNLKEVGTNLYSLEGDLINTYSSTAYRVTSSISIHTEGDPLSIETVIKPKSDVSGSPLVLKFRKENHGLSFSAESDWLNGTASVSYINYLNWDVRTRAEMNPDMIDITSPICAEYRFDTFLNVQMNGNTTLYIKLETPREDLKNLQIDVNSLISTIDGDIQVSQKLNEDFSDGHLTWRFVFLTDMFGKFVGSHRRSDDTSDDKDMDISVFFVNPKRAFETVNVGFDINIDNDDWRFATNTTVHVIEQATLNVMANVILPPPDNDQHNFLIQYRSIKGIHNAAYLVSYDTIEAKTHYASDGSIKMSRDDINGNFRVRWGHFSHQSINNVFNVSLNTEVTSLKYSLFTPKYLEEETALLLFSYNSTNEAFKYISADLHYPASDRIGLARISYSDIVNINGTVNVTTTMRSLTYIGCNFMLYTTLKHNERKVEIFWPNNTALIHSRYTYYSEKLDSSLDGTVKLEVPLNTRHIGYLTYGYKKKPPMTNGYSVLTYNGQNIYKGRYNSKGESRAGFERDRMEMTIENNFKPIGVIYVNQFEYSAGNEGTNYPTVEYKQVNVYRLDNLTAFNVIGESRIRTTHQGQDIHLKATHANRTVQLRTDYKVMPGEFEHSSWLSLAENAWVFYHLNIINRTTEVEENQSMIITLRYPKRNFTLDGSYAITSSELNSDATLTWISEGENNKTLASAFHWTNVSNDHKEPPLRHQKAILTFMHPSFTKNVTFTGRYGRQDIKEILNTSLVVDYSHDPNKLLVLSAIIRDESDLPAKRAYSYAIDGTHPKTRLLLHVAGVFHYSRPLLLVETKNHGNYKRSFLPEETGKFLTRLDARNYEVEFHRESNELMKYLKANMYALDPEYVVNGSMINTPNLNATGDFSFNWPQKVTRMMVNYTPDAIESLRMYGNIPDARNAIFDIWRTYEEDLVISDVSFYLKLNHSRLVTSTLRWRPELKSDVVNTIKSCVSNSYEELCNDIDYWKHYIKTETVAVVSDIWIDAREDVSAFIEDWQNLRVIENDFEKLKVFLNNSYNANDFYIKDIVAFGIYVVDELSLRSHIESLPNILSEIWEILGESGEALRNSLIWLIEAVKNAYRRISEIITAILKGDSLTQIAGVFEKLIEKYDMFIKDLHVSFIKYIENLWKGVSQSMSQQWNNFLKMIEPLFIRFIHYLETVAWKASKELVDFMYNRKNEIMTSPYFDRFTNFTQDIDKFYRDIKANDIFTNLRKYTSLAIEFLKERYFAFVPFGKELKDVVDEILTELKELEKLPSVHYALEKTRQVVERVNYLCEYFEVRSRFEYVLRVVHAKLMDVSQSALQAESRYREAKTKFIFDPNHGLMCLEQKLPMSWHAFNRTPEFHEIPEYRAIADMGSYFITSNTTFWTLYYHYKPYMEPSNWLPPFKARAMIAGPQHYVTFDGRHLEFAGSCTYLLARDFVRNQFAVLVKYDTSKEETRSENLTSTVTHKIIVLSKRNAVEINVFQDTVKLVNSHKPLQLPAELENGTIYIHQKESVVTIERTDGQFRLECNLKYDLCTLELSGWYFGKTAGLLGTMNNEVVDDFTTSVGELVRDAGKFAHSWAVDSADCNDEENYAFIRQEDEFGEISNGPKLCEELFANRSSEFASCFAVVGSEDYGHACLNSVNEMEACTIALAYMQACAFQNTYLRIPDRCTSCSMTTTFETVPEGEFRKLNGDLIPRSADIVFIVEAKECNRDIKNNRSIEQMITQLDKELQEKHLTENRWSLVIFGGNGVYGRPKSLVLDNRIFTKNVARFVDYFANIPIGKGNEDIFGALGFASGLVFRAGVSKIFILMPCSNCEPLNQSLDYSVLHQVLLEQDITLHILMDDDFQFEKGRLNKMFYGIDAAKSYTKKDARQLVGDVDLRRQVKLPKSALGYCTPLALETNGTIFTGNKLRYEKVAGIKKFSSVFSKRIALTAQPNSCQHCECVANNDGITKMECIPCIYPTPVTVSFVNETFNEDETLSVLQPQQMLDYSQMDTDDDR